MKKRKRVSQHVKNLRALNKMQEQVANDWIIAMHQVIDLYHKRYQEELVKVLDISPKKKKKRR